MNVLQVMTPTTSRTVHQKNLLTGSGEFTALHSLRIHATPSFNAWLRLCPILYENVFPPRGPLAQKVCRDANSVNCNLAEACDPHFVAAAGRLPWASVFFFVVFFDTFIIVLAALVFFLAAAFPDALSAATFASFFPAMAVCTSNNDASTPRRASACSLAGGVAGSGAGTMVSSGIFPAFWLSNCGCSFFLSSNRGRTVILFSNCGRTEDRSSRLIFDDGDSAVELHLPAGRLADGSLLENRNCDSMLPGGRYVI